MFEAIQNLLENPDQFGNLIQSYEQAVEAIDDFLKTDSQNIEALNLKIKILMRLHRFAFAKQVARTLVMLSGEESSSMNLFADASLQSGDFDGAESIYMRAYKLDPDSSFSFGSRYKLCKSLSQLKNEGNEFVSKNDHSKAIELYSKGLEKCEEYGLSSGFLFLNNRSACYMNMKRYDQALEDIDKSISYYPFFPKSYLRRITCIKVLSLTDRMAQLPMDYLNALFSSRYSDSTTKSICKEYIQFLRSNNAFKSNIRPILNMKDLERIWQNNPNALVVLDIYASWCGPCKQLAPLLDEMSVSHPSVVFLKIDGDKIREASTQYKVEGFPTVLLLRKGQELDRVVGYDPDGLENRINTNLSLDVDSKYE